MRSRLAAYSVTSAPVKVASFLFPSGQRVSGVKTFATSKTPMSDLPVAPSAPAAVLTPSIGVLRWTVRGPGRRWTAWGVEPPSCGCRRPAPLPQSVPRTGRVHPCWGWKAAAGQRLSLPVDVALTPQRVSVLEVCRAGGSDKGATPSRRAKAGGRTWWKGCRAPPGMVKARYHRFVGFLSLPGPLLNRSTSLGSTPLPPPTRDGSAGHPDGGHWLQGARPAARHLLSVSFRVATA